MGQMVMGGVMGINNRGVMFFVFVLVGILVFLGFVIMMLDGILGLILLIIECFGQVVIMEGIGVIGGIFFVFNCVVFGVEFVLNKCC